jgi:hypothetical protein
LRSGEATHTRGRQGGSRRIAGSDRLYRHTARTG